MVNAHLNGFSIGVWLKGKEQWLESTNHHSGWYWRGEIGSQVLGLFFFSLNMEWEGFDVVGVSNGWNVEMWCRWRLGQRPTRDRNHCHVSKIWQTECEMSRSLELEEPPRCPCWILQLSFLSFLSLFIYLLF